MLRYTGIILFLTCIVCVKAHSNAIANAVVTIIQQLEQEIKYETGSKDTGIIQRHEHVVPIRPTPFRPKRMKIDYTYSETHPTVRINSGLVNGASHPESQAFYSIPYANPPIGPLRFMPPQPVDAFTKALNASVPDYRMCYQMEHCDDDGFCDGVLMTEDCLVLNVNVPTSLDLSDPEQEPTKKLPVMVYIHGGFFFSGSGTDSEIDGRWISQAANAVVVTINYRLGPFGFLLFKENGNLIEANQGFKDQQLALQWVQDNIGKFGGDKDNVMIFGESAGAQSVHYHLISAKSSNLFKRALTESNPAAMAFNTVDQALGVTERVLQAIKCAAGDITCLRSIDPMVLATCTPKVMVRSLLQRELFNGIEPFRPYIDGVDFSDQHMKLFQEGKWNTDKEIIFGTNNEEMIYASALFHGVGLTLSKLLFQAFNNAILGPTNGEIVSNAYIALAGTRPGLDYDYSDILSQELTDLVFACPNRALGRFASVSSTAAKVSGQAPLYLYNSAYPFGGEACIEWNSVDGVCGYAFHSSEIIFVFKSPEGYGVTFTDNDDLASDIFSTYWSRFAVDGNPNSNLRPQLAEVDYWPPYSSENNWNNILIDIPKSVVQTDYREQFCDMLDATGFYINLTGPYQPRSVLSQPVLSQKFQRKISLQDHGLPEPYNGAGSAIYPSFFRVLILPLIYFASQFCAY
nr:uncharacterized protein LOC100180803 [Ciona intestinalis]|eukprot:XP_002120910.2 uncharacterized protein LOC100180803 [Ciona intestinalis]